MEIDITDFVTDADPFEFSASMAERGANAGRETWNNAKEYAADSPLLDTPEKLEAMREWAKETGAWNAEERAAWSEEEINALFIQLISGDIREAGLDACDLAEFDWEEHERQSQEGRISGNLYRGNNGRVYYYLGM